MNKNFIFMYLEISVQKIRREVDQYKQDKNLVAVMEVDIPDLCVRT